MEREEKLIQKGEYTGYMKLLVSGKYEEYWFQQCQTILCVFKNKTILQPEEINIGYSVIKIYDFDRLRFQIITTNSIYFFEAPTRKELISWLTSLNLYSNLDTENAEIAVAEGLIHNTTYLKNTTVDDE
jgi:hypothetical protein